MDFASATTCRVRMDHALNRTVSNLRLAISPRRVDWLGAGALVLLALGIFARNNLLQAPISHDMTLQMYAGQLISEGLPPYVNVGLVKTPLAAMVSALAILAGNLVGVWDILAVRFTFWFVMAFGAGGMYLWVRDQFQSRAAGAVAALAFLSLDVVGRIAAVGPHPKTLVVVAALFCFYAMARARWFPAGICAALAFLAWQPAGLLMPIVLVAPLLDPLRDRRRELLLAVMGIAVPLFLVLVYLVAQGALAAAVQDTFGANLSYLRSSSGQGSLLSRFSANFIKIVLQRGRNCFGNPWTLTWSLAGLGGLIATGLFFSRERKRVWLSRAYLPLIAYTVLFGAFTLLDYQVCDDLLPFTPITAFGAGGLVYLVGLGLERSRRSSNLPLRVAGPGLGLVFAAIILLTLPPARLPSVTLEKQAAHAAQVAPYLQPGDQIQQLGDAGLLVLLHRRNTTKLIFFGPKTGTGVLDQIPGGIDTIMRQLDANPPRIVALSHVRVAAAPWFKPLQAWLKQNYTELGTYEMYTGRSPNMQVLIRKNPSD